MNRVPILPNIITAFGLSCGLFVIFKMTMHPLGGVSYLALKGTAGILLLAGLADLLDGAIARVMNAQSRFGSHFDSLADAITFGVGPSVILIKSAEIDPQTEYSFFLTTAVMIFTVCGVLRLVRFNLSPPDAHKYFTGFPIPAGAVALVSMNLLLASPEFKGWITLTPETKALLLAVVAAFVGYLMISRWRFPSLKALQVNVASFTLVFLTVISAVFIFYGILYHFGIVFFLVVWLYLFLGLTLSILRWITGKRAKVLEDFEPASDDLEEQG